MKKAEIIREATQSTEKREMAMRLRQIRTEAGLTQEKMAERLALSVSAYKKIETSENQISVAVLRKLEREFKVSCDYILFGKEQDLGETWKMVVHCSEEDKLLLFLRLYEYFSKLNKRKQDQVEEPSLDQIMQRLDEMKQCD